MSRRSTTDIARIVSEIVSLLGEHAGGLRAEQIREHLGLVAKELPRPLKEGLDSGKLGKAGQKRATTYFLAGSRAGATKPPSKGRGRPAAPKGAGGAGKARKAAGVASKKSAKKSAAPKRRK